VLELKMVNAGYGPVTVLRDVNLSLAEGEVVTLLGPNGAGKTTLLRVLAGLHSPRSGAIELDGSDVGRVSSARLAQRGVCLVPEGRAIFGPLSVRDHLQLWCGDARKGIDRIADVFPVLSQRASQSAGTLSGGQQQMLALARAFVIEPAARFILLDEVSMGLSPILVDEILAAIRRLADTSVGVLLVEQYVDRALAMADRAYLLNKGVVTYDGEAALLSSEKLLHSYVGIDVEADRGQNIGPTRLGGE
jgi:branched-chain amino acid transport system ATP-binding protein